MTLLAVDPLELAEYEVDIERDRLVEWEFGIMENELVAVAGRAFEAGCTLCRIDRNLAESFNFWR